MKYLTPQKIVEITGGEYIGDDSARDIHVVGAVRDNRDVKPGNMFICIRGARVDGHSFAADAFAAGASCCLSERVIPDVKGPCVLVSSTLEAIIKISKYYRSLFDIPVIGITGSVGKTTAKEMTAAVLGEKMDVLKTQDNMNNALGVPLTLLSLNDSHDAAVIEMGISDFGEMSRLAEIVRPSIMIITKIGYSHLKSLRDLDGVFRAKTEVFGFMDADGVAILNGDDELLWRYDPGLSKITFGFNERNDFHAENVRAKGADEVVFDIVSTAGRFSVCIPSFGEHLVPGALAAAAAGRLSGLADEEISQGLLSYTPVGGRANVSDNGAIMLINDCYNANPNSVMAALSSLSALTKRRVAILGDMLELGEQSMRLHYDVGAFAAKSGLNSLICCGSMAAAICEGYKDAGGSEAYYFPAKTDLITALSESLSELIKKGDAVLIKASRGMAFEELLPFFQDPSRF